MFTNYAKLILGLLSLYLGAESLVRGGVGLSVIARIKPIIIGLTVVALGTSLPELTVSIMSVIRGASDISIGNIVGSNICNLLLILGISAAIKPIPIEKRNFKEDIPSVIVAAAILWILASDGRFSRLDGIILLLVYAVFLLHTFSKNKTEPKEGVKAGASRKLPGYLIMLIVGFALLIFGGWATVDSGTRIATHFGIPQYIIALTLIALGTSLPELATCAVASFKGKSDIAIGNVLGSNVCNSLLIIGIAALLQPFVIDADILSFSFPIMLLASVAMLLFVKSGMSLSRIEGVSFILGYVFYIFSLTFSG